MRSFIAVRSVLDNINRSVLNIDRTNLNLSIGKSLFNERLTFTFGSAADFGINTTYSTSEL